jgi:hypothetical protein
VVGTSAAGHGWQISFYLNPDQTYPLTPSFYLKLGPGKGTRNFDFSSDFDWGWYKFWSVFI